MEEEILKILKAGFYEFRNTRAGNWLAESYAKEITSMVMEFIQWLEFGNHPFIQWTDELGHFFTDELNTKRWNINELFEYWKTNIKK